MNTEVELGRTTQANTHYGYGLCLAYFPSAPLAPVFSLNLETLLSRCFLWWVPGASALDDSNHRLLTHPRRQDAEWSNTFLTGAPPALEWDRFLVRRIAGIPNFRRPRRPALSPRDGKVVGAHGIDPDRRSMHHTIQPHSGRDGPRPYQR